jgi:hypothetical protein
MLSTSGETTGFTDFACVRYAAEDPVGKLLAYAALLPFALILYWASRLHARRQASDGQRHSFRAAEPPLPCRIQIRAQLATAQPLVNNTMYPAARVLQRDVEAGVVLAGLVANEVVARGLKKLLRHPRPLATCAQLDVCDSHGMPSSHTAAMVMGAVLQASCDSSQPCGCQQGARRTPSQGPVPRALLLAARAVTNKALCDG